MRNVISKETIDVMKEYAKQSKTVADKLLTDIYVGLGAEDTEIDLEKEEISNGITQVWRDCFAILKDNNCISDEDYLKLVKTIM